MTEKVVFYPLRNRTRVPIKAIRARGESRLEFGVHVFNYVELFWNSLDNGPSSIVFYLEIKVEFEVDVHDIRPRFTPRIRVIC